MIPHVVRGNGFRGALDYIFDVKAVEQGIQTGKQPEIIATNMAGETPRQLAMEFGAIRHLNPKATNVVWHVSLSFPIGERPNDYDLDLIPGLFIDKVGAQATGKETPMTSDNNQFVAVAHHDTAHFHLHLLMNRINLDGEVCYAKWDHNRAQAAAREIEKELGLVQVKGDSKRLFLDGRLLHRLERQEKKTGVTDTQLEQYRKERKQRLDEIYAQPQSGSSVEAIGHTTEVVRATVGGSSERDPASEPDESARGTGSRVTEATQPGEGIGSPDESARGTGSRVAEATQPGEGIGSDSPDRLERFEQAIRAGIARYLETTSAADDSSGKGESGSQKGALSEPGRTLSDQAAQRQLRLQQQSRNRKPEETSVAVGGLEAGGGGFESQESTTDRGSEEEAAGTGGTGSTVAKAQELPRQIQPVKQAVTQNLKPRAKKRSALKRDDEGR